MFQLFKRGKKPMLNQIIIEQLYETQLALLEAESELERSIATVLMLRKRVERLSKW